MSAIEAKVISGGINLLEKAEEQERLLEEAQAELDAREAAAEKLQVTNGFLMSLPCNKCVHFEA